VAETDFRDIFAPRLRNRLLWFGRLRWIAVTGLAVASVLGPRLGLPSVWPTLCLVAAVVATYNLVFGHFLRAHETGRDSPSDPGVIAVGEIVLDLGALLVTVHVTGGLESPLLPFFAFHMAIGTILIPRRRMYLLAAAVSLGTFTMLVMEVRGTLGFHPLVGNGALDLREAALNLVTLVVALFGIVYLTGTVADQLRRTSDELSQTARVLKERSEQLQKLVEQTEDIERRKSHYMRISAHQLRSPLATIRTSLRVLTEGFAEPNSSRGRALLVGSLSRTDELLAIVNDLLGLAKIREGRARAPWRRRINVNQLLIDLLDSVAPAAEEQRIELIPDFDAVTILDWGIPPDLVHAFQNLIDNAIKYSHPRGRVTVQLRNSGGAACVRVIDGGIGIPDGFLSQVFLEFVRAPNAKSHARHGTGLGLAIVREVVEAHGGKVSVESRLGEGTTFTVVLPLHRAPRPREQPLPPGNESGYHADTPQDERDPG
jgi:signal transduction histidine kinase